MGEQKNLMLALGLSMLVMFGFNEFYFAPKLEEAQRQQATYQAAQEAAAPVTTGTVPTSAPMMSSDGAMPMPATDAAPAPTLGAAVSILDLDQALDNRSGVRINTPELHGSINLTGARLDDLTLVKHKTSMDKDADEVRILAPEGTEGGYFARFGWQGQNLNVPGDDAVWTADKNTLTPHSPVTLTWDNGAGLLFKQVIDVDADFMFSVTQSVTNNSDASVALAPFGIVKRDGTPKTEGLYILHEGPIGVLGGELVEVTYSDLEDETFTTASEGGWLGITDKYWMTVMIPDVDENLSAARFLRRNDNGISHQVDYITSWKNLAAGKTIATENHLYAGAKIVNTIDRYEQEYHIPLFDRTIDWGWFYWITRPIFKGLDFLFGLVGNFGVAILLLTVAIKGLLFPLANKSYVSMSHMKKVQPKIKAMQERYKDDKPKLQKEMMALYQKEKINPLAGCLPIFVQIPIFFSLYKVLMVTIEMRHQPFFGWIQDLSAKDPVTPLNLFGLIPWDPPSMIAIGIWPILMGVTMWMQQQLNPQTMEPAQQKIMSMLPIVFTFVLANFAAGLVIYWTWNSILSVAQQWYIMRREDARQASEA